jgi:hypothetical protein
MKKVGQLLETIKTIAVIGMAESVFAVLALAALCFTAASRGMARGSSRKSRRG